MEIIGHRGASALCPENTTLSIETALQMGMDGVELDLQLSADGAVVLAHDETLERVARNTFGLPQEEFARIITTPIEELTLAEIQSVDVGGRVPTLRQALQLIPEGKIAMLDIKSDNHILPFLELEGAKCEIIMVAFSLKLIRKIKAWMPQMPCYYIRLYEQLKENLDDILEDGADLEGFSFEASSIITQDLIALLHTRGQKLMTWVDPHPAPIDTAKTRSEYAKMGVDYFITNGV